MSENPTNCQLSTLLQRQPVRLEDGSEGEGVILGIRRDTAKELLDSTCEVCRLINPQIFEACLVQFAAVTTCDKACPLYNAYAAIIHDENGRVVSPV